MKKFLLTLLIFFTIACGAVRETRIPTKTETIVYSDTTDLNGLAKWCKEFDLHPSLSEQTIITYYELIDDVVEDFVYTDDKNRTYVISKCRDGKYILTISVKNP